MPKEKLVFFLSIFFQEALSGMIIADPERTWKLSTDPDLHLDPDR